MTCRRFVPAVLIAAAALTGCGVAPSVPLPTDIGGGETDDADSETTTTTTTTTVVASPESTTTTTVAAPAVDPLMLNISIHVEGHQSEATNEDEYWMHAGEVREVADAAYAAGVTLSFEVSTYFVEAAATWGDTVLTDLVAQGHAVGVHADLDTTNARVFVETLIDMREALAAAGIETTFLSGICSPGPWVEAAIDAGYDAVSGIVEYCLLSMPQELWPAGKEHVAECGDASECHGAVYESAAEAINPIHTSSSADWLTDDPDGELMVIVGGANSVHCLAEDAAAADGRHEGRCTSADDDIPLFLDVVEEYLAARQPGEVNVLTFTWSIGNNTTAEFATDLFAAVAAEFEASEIAWSTIADITVAAAGT